MRSKLPLLHSCPGGVRKSAFHGPWRKEFAAETWSLQAANWLGIFKARRCGFEQLFSKYVSKAHYTFKAHAFHPDLGNEVVEGQIFFADSTLHFESSDCLLQIPMVRLKPELGKGNDDRLFLADPEQPGLKIITDPGTILNCRFVPEAQEIREQLNARLSRNETSRRIKFVVGALAVCALVAWAGMLGTGMMVRSLASKVSPEFEEQFGSELLAEIESQAALLNDTNREERLATIAAPLLKVLPTGKEAYQFHIIEDEDPNAFALPGGHVVATTGLLSMAERPEELLGVFAHEIAHVNEKHGFRMAISATGPFLICQMFFSRSRGVSDAVAGSSALLIGQSFSQKYEMEADDVGWDYLVKANVDPRGMTDMFQKLRAYEAKQKGADIVPNAFSSHPALDKRISRLDSKWKKLKRKSGFVELPSFDKKKP